MCSKGWGFRKAGTTFPYLLFLVSYSLFPSVFAPLRALRETKNVQKVGHFGSDDLGVITNHQNASTSLFLIFNSLFVVCQIKP
jgi:hypothetical protein